MSKTFNKNLQYTFNPQITLPTSSGLSITSNSNTIGNLFTTGGNIGIANTAPLYTFDVNGTLEASNANGLILFSSSGNVGIGTTTPTYKLDVNGTLEASNTNGLMLFASSGNLGIGTTTPQSSLSIYSSSTAGIYNITSNNSSYSFIYAVRRRNNNADMVTGDLMGEIGFAGSHNGFQNTPMTTLRGIYAGNGNNRSAHLTFLTENVDSNLQERMRLTNSGSLGIGTTAPSTKLHIYDPTVAINSLLVLHGGPSGQNNAGSRLLIGGCANHYSAIEGYHESNGKTYIKFKTTGDVTGGATNFPQDRITLDWQGFLGIGTTTPSWPLHITTNNGNYAWPSSGYYFTTSTTFSFASSGFSGNNSILATGGITSNNGFYATSDIRIKKIIQQGINEIKIDDIDKLTISKFEYIDKLVHGNDVKLGFIAQNVHEIIPEAVTIRKEFVPNIFKVVNVNNGIIELENHNLTVGTLIKIMIDEQDRNGNVTKINRIIDANYLSIEYDLGTKDKLFIYGTEVDDFKELNYNHIFTLSVGAVQKLRQDVRSLEDKFEKLYELIQKKFPNELIF